MMPRTQSLESFLSEADYSASIEGQNYSAKSFSLKLGAADLYGTGHFSFQSYASFPCARQCESNGYLLSNLNTVKDLTTLLSNCK